MKLGVACLLWLLLVCLTLPSTHGHVLGRSMEIRSKENRSKGLSSANTLPPTPSASPGSTALGGGEELLPLCGSTGLLGDILCNSFYPPHPPSLLPRCSPSSHLWAQCPVPFHVLQSPDGFSAFPSQIRTSTPRGTRAAGSGRWGASGGDKPWEGAPTLAGPGSRAVQTPTLTPTFPGMI